MTVRRRLCSLLVGFVALVGLSGVGSGTAYAASNESCVDNWSGELCLSIRYITATHLTEVRATQYYDWGSHCDDDHQYMTFVLKGTYEDGTAFTRTEGPYDLTSCYDGPFLDHEYTTFGGVRLDVKSKSSLCVRADYVRQVDGNYACFTFP
ncbi:hypothetical protein ACGFYQ_41205 [Streptomyces sp. NPDC048258]|uniref:hypothetical protein n=1 Tax=Streptomyces sp. NPDC048258 TaxID=3365527 RepID=UPI00371BF4A5